MLAFGVYLSISIKPSAILLNLVGAGGKEASLFYLVD
jgi:hypothetical protein